MVCIVYYCVLVNILLLFLSILALVSMLGCIYEHLSCILLSPTCHAKTILIPQNGTSHVYTSTVAKEIKITKKLSNLVYETYCE